MVNNFVFPHYTFRLRSHHILRVSRCLYVPVYSYISIFQENHSRYHIYSNVQRMCRLHATIDTSFSGSNTNSTSLGCSTPLPKVDVPFASILSTKLKMVKQTKNVSRQQSNFVDLFAIMENTQISYAIFCN